MADFNNWRELTKVIQLKPPTDNFFTTNFFKKNETSSTDLIMIEDLLANTNGVARLVGSGQPAHILKKLGGSARYLRLMETYEKYFFTTQEYQDFKTLGNNVIDLGTKSEVRLSEWDNHILRHTAMLKERVERRYEMMCAQAIFTGKIDITEDDVQYKADFGYEDNVNLFDVSGEYFTVSNLDLVLTLRKWIKSVKRKSGLSDIIIVMGEEAADLYLGHAEVKKSLNNLNYQVGTLKPFQNLSGFGADLIHMVGTIPVYEYKNTYKNAAGSTVDMTDPKNVGVIGLSGDYRKIKGMLHRFKKDSNSIEATVVEMLAEIRTNEDRTATNVSLRNKTMPAILTPNSIEIHKVKAG